MSELQKKLTREAQERGYTAAYRDVRAGVTQQQIRARLTALGEAINHPARGSVFDNVKRDQAMEISSLERRFQSDAQTEFTEIFAYMLQLGALLDAAAAARAFVLSREADGKLTLRLGR